MEVNEQRAGNRMILLLIAGIPVMVILIATWLWYYVVQGDLDLVAALGTSNSGTLVQPPRELQDVDLVEGGALPFRYGELDPKWSFVIPGVASCDLICEKSLYTTRQIHIALGKEFNRIRRVYVSDTASADTALDITRLTDDHPAPASFDAYLQDEHRGLKAVKINPAQHAELFREYADNRATWYLVDPAGWIMMSYDGEVSYKGVISDLKFLLKNSSE